MWIHGIFPERFGTLKLTLANIAVELVQEMEIVDSYPLVEVIPEHLKLFKSSTMSKVELF